MYVKYAKSSISSRFLLFLHLTIHIDLAITGISMSLSAVEVDGGPHTLDLTVETGNDITLEIDWGDDTLEEFW